MLSRTLFFLFGILSVLLLSHLPSLTFILSALSTSILTLFVLPKTWRSWLSLPLILIAGFCWAAFQADQILAWKLPENLMGQPVSVTGKIVDVPQIKDKETRFQFKIQKLQNNHLSSSPLILLSWYQSAPELHSGEKWKLNVRLKTPHGFANPGSFDYEAWLFEHRIRATGYVQSGNLICSDNRFHFSFLDSLRENIANSITKDLKDYPLAGLITALSVGIRNAITPQQWNILRATGTNHLFAIAGLHIGLVSSIIFFLMNFIWRRCNRLMLWIPAQQAAAFSALIAALFYSALAGFSLPTQRAIIMIGVFLIAHLRRKNLPPLTALSLSLLAVLIWNPLAVISNSFWLSFVAVAFIIYGMSGRVRSWNSGIKWMRIQWILTISLLPLGLLFFQEASLLGFIANLIAIPLTGFIVLPLCLLGDIFFFIIPPLSHYIFVLAERALELVWIILTKISEQQGAQWHLSVDNFWIFFSVCLAIILLLAPRKFPARFFGLIGLLPLILWSPQKPTANELWFSLLDVGKGFSAFVQTQHTALLFDTGNHNHSQLDSAIAVIIPFLMTSHINALNMLVISDADNAHMGGTESLLKHIRVEKILTTIPYYFLSDTAKNCYAGQEWNWDGVQYEMLYPEKNNSAENNACVLKISTSAESILLLGDVGKKGLKDLLKKSSALLKADIVVIPNITHSADILPQFIQAVHPEFVLFPEPSQHTLINNNQNIQNKINYYTTQEEGAISFELSNKKENLSPILYRKKHFYFWNQQG